MHKPECILRVNSEGEEKNEDDQAIGREREIVSERKNIP